MESAAAPDAPLPPCRICGEPAVAALPRTRATQQDPQRPAVPVCGPHRREAVTDEGFLLRHGL